MRLNYFINKFCPFIISFFFVNFLLIFDVFGFLLFNFFFFFFSLFSVFFILFRFLFPRIKSLLRNLSLLHVLFLLFSFFYLFFSFYFFRPFHKELTHSNFLFAFCAVNFQCVFYILRIRREYSINLFLLLFSLFHQFLNL